jgi:sugar phosphate isomerase/epimerase
MLMPTDETTAADLPLSLNQLSARDLSLTTLARAARESGFRGIGVLPSTVAELGVDGTRSVLDGEGLQPTSVSALIGLVGPTPTAQAQRIVVARQYLEYAAGLGVPLVVVVGGPDTTVTVSEAWRQAEVALAELVDSAARIGATVLVEPLHPVLINMSVLTSMTDALTLARGHQDVGVVVDTWHVWWDLRLGECLRRAIRRVGIVHLSDWTAAPAGDLDRALPGEGISDLPSLCADLLSAGFRGWWEVEVLSEALWAGDQVALVRASYEATITVLDKALSLARQVGRAGEVVR